MKKLLLITIIIISVFLSCSKKKTPVIGMTMAYWQGKYQINKSYVDAIRENGGIVRLISCTDNEDFLKEEIKELDGFVFIGGRDYPPQWYGKDMHKTMNTMSLHRAVFDTLLMDIAIKSGKPILGICAGEQLMNIATGGKLIRHIEGHRGVKHMIGTQENSIIAELFGDSLEVNSFHHQCVEPDHLNENFKITAFSADSIVECIEWQGEQWMFGTQFHPERLPTVQRDKIIMLFLAECMK